MPSRSVSTRFAARSACRCWETFAIDDLVYDVAAWVRPQADKTRNRLEVVRPVHAPLGTFTADENGSFVTTITIPSSTSIGSHLITATCGDVQQFLRVNVLGESVDSGVGGGAAPPTEYRIEVEVRDGGRRSAPVARIERQRTAKVATS